MSRRRAPGRLGQAGGRRRAPGRPAAVITRGTTTGTLGMGGGGDKYLREAADVIAAGARDLAGWSRKIPGRIKVTVGGGVAIISSQEGPSYPNEIKGVRHPTFGHEPWVTNQHRPFLAPAADAKADPAMAKYADKITALARNAGFK